MLYTPEFIIAAILVVAVLVYFMRPQYKNFKSEILGKYRRVRSKSLHMQDVVSSYILANDGLKKLFLPDVTYGEFLRQLKKSHSLYLSEKVYVKIKNSRSLGFLKKMNKILDEQEQKLDEVENQVMALHTMPAVH
jgi:hypothetical protein